jgi:hypothetical protein
LSCLFSFISHCNIYYLFYKKHNILEIGTNRLFSVHYWHSSTYWHSIFLLVQSRAIFPPDGRIKNIACFLSLGYAAVLQTCIVTEREPETPKLVRKRKQSRQSYRNRIALSRSGETASSASPRAKDQRRKKTLKKIGFTTDIWHYVFKSQQISVLELTSSLITHFSWINENFVFN